MFENLFNLVTEHAGDTIINNPAIPNERNNDAIQEAFSAIVNGLQGTVAGGGTADIMGFFGNHQNIAASALTQNIQGGFVQNLVSKFGVDQGQAASIAGSLIPSVLQNFVHKTNDPNDSSFDLQGIIGHLTAGSNSGPGLMDMVKGLMK